MSPTRSANCSTRPFTPARITVLSRSTCACASAASALAFSAGNSVVIRSSRPCFVAVAAEIAPSRPRTRSCSRSISRRATLPGLRRYSSCLVSSSSTACWSALLASSSWPSAFTTSARATGICASISTILRRADLDRSLLLRAVEPEDRRAFLDRVVVSRYRSPPPVRSFRAGSGMVRKNSVTLVVDGWL